MSSFKDYWQVIEIEEESNDLPKGTRKILQITILRWSNMVTDRILFIPNTLCWLWIVFLNNIKISNLYPRFAMCHIENRERD